jgi:hypothetical protein
VNRSQTRTHCMHYGSMFLSMNPRASSILFVSACELHVPHHSMFREPEAKEDPLLGVITILLRSRAVFALCFADCAMLWT